MKTISKLLLACAAVTIAASQADAGEFVVTGRAGTAIAMRRRPPTPMGPGDIAGIGRPATTRRSTTTISAPRLRARWPVPRCS